MPALPWRTKRLTEFGSRCEECATYHVIFEEKSDHGVIVPAAEVEELHCTKCGAVLLSLDVKDGTSIFVLLEDDPQVSRLRRKMARQPKVTFKRVDWEHPNRTFLVVYALVVFLAAVAWIGWLRFR